ncbi:MULTISPECIES: hypothetical protein [Dactylosporangium]|nr:MULTISPECIES: hypothetical protein [Dactylosporangium]UAB95824.1 hypothetical protein Dvina_48955 [Dactylosporangium vinaceum]
MAGFAVAAVGAFVVVDRGGGTERFADLPGGVDVRLVGRFTPVQVERLGQLPEAAAVECDDTLYDVGIATGRLNLGQVTVLTAVKSAGLQRAALVQGRGVQGDAEMLAVDGRGLRLGERVTVTRGGRGVAGTVVGVVARPSGQPDAVALLPAAAMARLDGRSGCGEVVVQLKRRSQATAFQRAARGVVGRDSVVTYDESLRGHV